jgi:hypothetical protein
MNCESSRSSKILRRALSSQKIDLEMRSSRYLKMKGFPMILTRALIVFLIHRRDSLSADEAHTMNSLWVLDYLL